MTTLWRLFRAEFRRELVERWSYRFNVIGWYVMWLVMLPMMLVIFDQVVGGYGRDRRLETLIGFLVWDLCIMGGLTGVVSMVGKEAKEGTLESYLLSPQAPVASIGLRIAIVFVLQFVQTVLLGVLLALVLGVSLTFSLVALLVLSLTVVGMCGLGLALAGLTLLHKQLDGMIGLISLVSILFTGALAPLNDLGAAFHVIRWLMPTAWGIDALRQTMVHGATWADLWRDGTWAGLSVQVVVYLLIGLVLFSRNWRAVRWRGSLGSY